MVNLKHITGLICGALIASGVALGGPSDHVRNVKEGEAVPAFRMPTTNGKFIDNTAYADRVVVLVYLSAEQKSSELAAADSAQVIKKFKDDPVTLVHVTADVVHKPYFDRLRAEQGIEDVPLGLDASRKLYGDLGLIVFPTTIITDKEGKLKHVISTRSPEYPRVLEGYIRHALGEIDEQGLTEWLNAQPTEMGSPKSLASRHRAAARLLREKGMIEDARRELLKASEYDPEDPNIRLDLAEIDLDSDDAGDALTLAAAVLADQPEHRRAKQIAGIAKFKLGEFDEARTLLTESLVLNPDPARAMYYLGRIDEMQGREHDAMLRYREAAEHLLKVQ
ncbi:MAG: tetratricopeptide repeat protein [Phycisphaeraceae bacterium]|nr:MAG: tetratricopeptide repeat protein [Phycisphaeraceae bacterium]